MFIIRTPRSPHVPTHHQASCGGNSPDPCEGARNAMMFLHHLHQHAMEQEQGQAKAKAEKNEEQDKTTQEEKKTEDDKKTEPVKPAAEIPKTTKSSSPRQHQSRTYFQRALVKHTRTEESDTIALDVPGYTAENLTVKLGQDHMLTVTGKRKNRIGDTFVIHHRFDVEESKFDEETLEASLVDGVLEITVQKKPEPKARLIPIATTSHHKESPKLQEAEDDTEEDDDDSNKVTNNVPTEKGEVVVESVSEKEEEEDAEEEATTSNKKEDAAWEEVVAA